MSEGQSGPTYGDLSSLRAELMSEIRDVRNDVASLQNWVQREIQRLEDEMREVGQMIVEAINHQTAAVVGGVAATTVMLERTKNQIEEDFSQTRNKLQLQTESTLQIEIGKKIADVGAVKSKLEAFISDIKSRFDKAVEGATINRELYNVNFRKIADEYQNKINTIGSYIFQIKLEDIAPAVKAAQIPYEVAHGLPIEMDLTRLSARSENLEETLNLLKSSRLDEVVASFDLLDTTLDQFSLSSQVPDSDVSLCVEGLATHSPLSTRLLAGLTASEVDNGKAVALSLVNPSLAAYSANNVSAQVTQAMQARTFREVSGQEIVGLVKAATDLRARNLISEDAHALLSDFLGSGSLKYLET